METLHIGLVGSNHHVAPVGIRDVLFPDSARLDEFFEGIESGRWGAREGVAVVTCLRAEFYVAAEDAGQACARVRAWMTGDRDDLAEHVYSHTDRAAVHHLLRVATGLDSLMVGEHEILGQVRDAADVSRKRGTVGMFLDHLFQGAVRAGRRARRETGVGRGGTSLAFAASEFAHKEVPEAERAGAVIVGAGRTGSLIAQHLSKGGWTDLTIVNRTLERAESLARERGARARPLEELPMALRDARVVALAARVPEPLVTEDTLRLRSGAPLLVLDLGSPRNAAPEIDGLEGVQVRHLDRFREVADANRARRAEEIPRVEHIVEEEGARFRSWVAHRSVVPLVKKLRESFAGIAEAEMERHARNFPPEEREALERYTRSLLNKLLHYPTVHLKELADDDPGHAERMAMFSDIFVAAGWGGSGTTGERAQ